MEMASYIFRILRSQPIIVMSWGFHCPVAVKDGLRFLVEGRLHKGCVEVVYDEGADLFIARTIKKGQLIREEKDIYFDCLIGVIDRMVETQ